MAVRKIDVVLVKRNEELLDLQLIHNFEDKLENYYKAIECDTIDIITRVINGRIFDFVIDDEYLLTHKTKDAPTGLFLNDPYQEQIYGSFIITGTADDDGKLTSITAKDFKEIKKAVLMGTRKPINLNETTEIFETIAYTI